MEFMAQELKSRTEAMSQQIKALKETNEAIKQRAESAETRLKESTLASVDKFSVDNGTQREKLESALKENQLLRAAVDAGRSQSQKASSKFGGVRQSMEHIRGALQKLLTDVRSDLAELAALLRDASALSRSKTSALSEILQV